MNLGNWPDGVAFDPAAGLESLELTAIISGPGADWPSVLLAAGERARASGWAARAALSIAEAWATRGRRVVLADVCLERPELHDHLGEPNNEGLADVFMFGASPASVTHHSDGRAFEFLPPGAFVPDPAGIYRSREWSKLLRSMQLDGSLLVAYAPLEADGFDALAARIGNVIVLAAEPDVAQERAALPASLVQLVLRPTTAVPALELEHDGDDDEPGAARRPPRDEDDEPGAAQRAAADDTGERLRVADISVVARDEPATAAADEPRATPMDDPLVTPADEPATRQDRDERFEKIRLPKEGAREALIANLRQRQREAMMVPPPGADRPDAGAPPPTAPPAGAGAADRPVYPASPPELRVAPTEPDFAAAQQPKPRRRRRGVLVATLIIVAILSVIGGAWHFVGSYLEQRRAAAPPAATAPAAPIPAAVEPATALRYSVAIEAHQNFDVAMQRLGTLQEEEDRFSFYVTPVLVNNSAFYRLMAGPVPDSASAAAMMAELLAAGHKTGSSPADIRVTPFAFLLGSTPTRAEAERRADELQMLAIPAHIILHDTPDGLVYRIYGGGYASQADAQVMRELLQSAGQPDSLVERIGRIPR